MFTHRVLLRSTCFLRASNHLRTSSFGISLPNISYPRQLSVTANFKMPEPLKSGEVHSQTDPSVAKQYDNESPKEQQIKDLFNMIDGKKIGMLNTYRNGVGRLYPALIFPPFLPPFHIHDTNNNVQDL